MTIKAMEQQLINLGFTKTVSKKVELGMTITNIYFELFYHYIKNLAN